MVNSEFLRVRVRLEIVGVGGSERERQGGEE